MKYEFNFSLLAFGLTTLLMIFNIMVILQYQGLFVINWLVIAEFSLTVINLLIACIQKEKE